MASAKRGEGRKTIEDLFADMKAEEDTLEVPEASAMQELVAAAGVEATEEGVLAAYEAVSVSIGDHVALDKFTEICEMLGCRSNMRATDEKNAEVHTSIAARGAQGSFPEVLPTELRDMSEERDAEYTLSFAQKTQVVQIQSFVDAEYQKYRTSMPEAAVVEPEPIIRAKWARANYYTMLRQVVPVFEPELAIHQVAEAKRGRCFQLLTEVTEAHVELVGADP